MRKLFVIPLVILLLSGLILSGCAEPTSTTPAPTTPAPQPSTPTTPTEPAKPIEIKFAIATGETHFRTKFIYWFADELDSRTEGRTETTVYAGGALGGQAELPDNVMQGLVQMAVAVPSHVPGLVPVNDLLSVPFFCTDPIAKGYIGWDLFNKGYLSMENAKILMIHAMEPSELWMSKKKVNTVEDFQGLVLSCQNPTIPFLQKLGAGGTQVAPPDIYSSLERGVIDGIICGSALARNIKYEEVVKYWCINGIANDLHLIVMNQEFYNSLPDDIKVILLDFSREANSELSRLAYQQFVTNRDYYMADERVEVYSLSTEELGRLQKIAEPFVLETAQALDAQGEHGTEALEIAMMDLRGMGAIK